MIDCHCHLLPGIDDGPKSLEEAVAMARSLCRIGYAEVHCTPHCISGLYENAPALVDEQVHRLQAELDRVGVPLRLWSGMEYYLDSRFPERLPGVRTLGVTRLVLVEAPAWSSVELLIDNLQRVVVAGYVPLIAHPERCRLLGLPGQARGLLERARRLFGPGQASADPGLLPRLQQLGCLFQGNLGSFAGRYGQGVKERAEAFLEAGLYSCLGSDSHPHPGLEEMLATGVERVRLLTDQHRLLLNGQRLFERS